MLTLTAASKETRLILKWAGIILASIFVIVLIFRTVLILKDTFFPTPPPKPTVLFGKLPSILFPASAANENFKYSINTLSGDLPKLPDQMKIYEVKSPKADLLALKNVGEGVGKAGFENGPFKVSDDIYFWTNSRGDFLKTIRVNIQEGSFTVFSPFYFNNDILSGKNLPKEKEAIKYAEDFLSSMDYLADDLDLSKTRTNLLSIKDGQLTGAISLSSAHAWRVNFFQRDIDNYPILYEKPNESSINVVVTGGDTGSQIVRANYLLQQASSESSTYPLKTPEEAYNELREGKAYIASFYGEGSSVKINDVYLAYYTGSQEFLYPIMVFEGSGGFYAYVSAIRDEWIGN